MALAQSPLESMDVQPRSLLAAIRGLDPTEPPQANSYVWLALALGRLGHFRYLGKVIRRLHRGWPGVFWGNPFAAQADLRRMLPIPQALDDFLSATCAEVPWYWRLLPMRPNQPSNYARLFRKGLTQLPPPPAKQDPPLTNAIIEAAIANATFPFSLAGGAILEDRQTTHESLSHITAHIFETALSNHADNPDWPMFEAVGNPYLQLMDQLPEHQSDVQSITASYLKFLEKHKRSENLETQIGWVFSRGDNLNLGTRLKKNLLAKNTKTRVVTWSLLTQAMRFGRLSAPPYLGAGETVGDSTDLYKSPQVVIREVLPDDALLGDGALLDLLHEHRAALGDDKDLLLGVGRDEPSNEVELGDLGPPDPPQDDQDPPRSAYGLLKAPKHVNLTDSFDVLVGLSEKKLPGVAGEKMVRPETSHGPYLLTIKLSHDGFISVDGTSAEVDLKVTVDNPYPTRTLQLKAIDDEQFKPGRNLLAYFFVDGQIIGAASCHVEVGDTDERPDEFYHSGFRAIFTTKDAPDLTLIFNTGNRKNNYRWVWSVETPHDISIPPQEDPTIDFGGKDPSAFAQNLMFDVDLRDGESDALDTIKSAGQTISKKLPPFVQDSIRNVRREVGVAEKPTLLIVSEEPHVPWELAFLRLTDDERQFLSAEFVVGRWALGEQHSSQSEEREPPLPPPTKVTARSMAVISGDYSESKQFDVLPGATDEAEHLQEAYDAIPIDAKHDVLIDWLDRGADNSDVIHFCVHGKWNGDSVGSDAGIALVDGRFLKPAAIRTRKFRSRPFVFLNACQVGQGDSPLGTYGGLAAAFLEAGATAVIAPLWSINDEAASKIAMDFYKKIKTVPHPGEVVQIGKTDALQMFDEKKAKSPTTYLAYQYFGDPRTRLELNL